MKKILLSVITIISLVGCSAGLFQPPYYGAEKHMLYCANIGENGCKKQAANICPNGYIIDEEISAYRGDTIVLWSMRVYCK